MVALLVHMIEIDRRRANRRPRVRRDLEDDESDSQANDWIRDAGAQRDGERAHNDGERDEAVDPSVVSVGGHCGTREALARPQTNLSGDLVPDEAHESGPRERPQVRQVLRVYEAQNRLVERDAGRDEDRKHHGEAGKLLAADAPQVEGDPERHGRERVSEVMDQVCEESDRARERKDEELYAGGEAEDNQAY